jgi:RNA polymerase sigma-70 factor (ECF subfamily)
VLYEETFEAVYDFAMTLVGDRDAAEELIADTYMRAWRARSSFSVEGSALSRLMYITHDSVMDNLALHLSNSVGDSKTS